MDSNAPLGLRSLDSPGRKPGTRAPRIQIISDMAILRHLKVSDNFQDIQQRKSHIYEAVDGSNPLLLLSVSRGEKFEIRLEI